MNRDRTRRAILSAISGLYWLLDFEKNEHGGLGIDRTLRKRIEAHRKQIGDIRGPVEHLEREIKSRDSVSPIMLMVSADDESVILEPKEVKK